jgi:aspartyl protease family protein
MPTGQMRVYILEPKNPYRKTARQVNYRGKPDSASPSLHIWLVVAVGALFLIVLAYERVSERGYRHASPILAETATPQEPSSVGVGQATSKPERTEKQAAPSVMVTSPNPIPHLVPVNSPPETLENPNATFQYVMERDGFGNLVGLGSINGKDVRFLADTGATTVVIPEKIAQAIGLKKGAPVSFKTAGGIIVHFSTTLDSLRLGRIEMRKVSAAINPTMQDDFILLGMSALGLMDMQMEQGRMVLKYKASASEAAALQPVNDEPFKRSYKECAGQGNQFNQQTLNCLRGK